MTDEVRERTRRYLTSVLGPLPSGALESSGTKSLLDEYARAYAAAQPTTLAMQALGAPEQEPQSRRRSLESIIVPRARPAVLIQDDDFSSPPAPWEWLEQKRYVLRPAIAAAGRIEVRLPEGELRRASGFLVAENLFMTNRHVAELFVSGSGVDGLAFLPGGSAQVDFKSEYERSAHCVCTVSAPVLIHPVWDLALLRLSGAESIAPLPLVANQPAVLGGRPVATIGHPVLEMNMETLQLQIEVFNGVFERKRLQPGNLMGEECIDYFGHRVSALTHDCSTLGGNSGSAVVDIASGLVIGLHFAGQHLQANYAVPTWELAPDPVVRALGVQFQPLPATTSAHPVAG